MFCRNKRNPVGWPPRCPECGSSRIHKLPQTEFGRESRLVVIQRLIAELTAEQQALKGGH